MEQTQTIIKAEEIAELFHNTYESLAPAYGYETRQDTKNFDPNSPNGKLMIAVSKVVSTRIYNQVIDRVEEILGKKRLPTEKPNSMRDGYNEALDDVGKFLSTLRLEVKE